MTFRPIYYGEQERGKNIPNTKRRYIWQFDINNVRHQLELFCSFLSSKRKVALDLNVLLETKNFGFDFEWKYELDGINLHIKQDITTFPLFWNNQDFITTLQEEAERQREEVVEKAIGQEMANAMKSIQNGQVVIESGTIDIPPISNVSLSDFNYPAGIDRQRQRMEKRGKNGVGLEDIEVQLYKNYHEKIGVKQIAQEDLLLLDQNQNENEQKLIGKSGTLNKPELRFF